MQERCNIRVVMSKYGIQVFERYIKYYLEYFELSDKYNLLKNVDVRYETELYVCLGWNHIDFYADTPENLILKRVLQLLKDEDISYSYITDEYELGKCVMEIYRSKEKDVFVTFPEFDIVYGFNDEKTLKQLKKYESEVLSIYGKQNRF